MGFANRRKETWARGAGGRKSGVGANLHKAGDTRACIKPDAEYGEKVGKWAVGALVNAKAQRKEERSCPKPSIVCISSYNEVFATTTRTCAAFVLNDVSTISVTPSVHYA